MLKITPLATYNLPRYPRGGQYVRAPKGAGTIARDTAALLALAALLESCGDIGHVTGAPVVKTISETAARDAISRVFADRNISLAADQNVTVSLSPRDSVVLTVDEFNDSLQVGVEYIKDSDAQSFTNAVQTHLDSTKYTTPPHILAVDAYGHMIGQEEALEAIVEQFLDSLQAHGVI